MAHGLLLQTLVFEKLLSILCEGQVHSYFSIARSGSACSHLITVLLTNEESRWSPANHSCASLLPVLRVGPLKPNYRKESIFLFLMLAFLNLPLPLFSKTEGCLHFLASSPQEAEAGDIYSPRSHLWGTSGELGSSGFSMSWGPFCHVLFLPSGVSGSFCLPRVLFAPPTHRSVVSGLHFPQFLYYNNPSVFCVGRNLGILSLWAILTLLLTCMASLSSSIY